MTDSTSKLLLQRLTNIEKIVNYMLEMPNFDKFHPLIEKKVLQFEEMIAQFPESDEHLAEDARAKLISMYSRLYNVSGHSSPVTSPSEDSVDCSNIVVPSICHSSDSLNSETKEVPVTSDKPKSAANGNGSSALLPTPREPPLLFSLNHASSTSAKPQACFDSTKCKLRQEIEASIARLSAVESGADVESVKALLAETARTRIQLAKYPRDSRLQSTIFNLAFSKLPLKMRDQFLSIYGSLLGGISLSNLVSFLQAEIVAQNAKTVNLVNKIIYSKAMGQNFNHQKQVDGGLIRCKYCKSRGHVRDDCAFLKGLLCFKCYKSGHIKRDCPHYTFR